MKMLGWTIPPRTPPVFSGGTSKCGVLFWDFLSKYRNVAAVRGLCKVDFLGCLLDPKEDKVAMDPVLSPRTGVGAHLMPQYQISCDLS